MRILSRLSDIVAANFHALLDQVENPEALLAHVVREMEESLAAARRYAASAIAAERRIGRELEQNRVEVEHWHRKAREALTAGREDLARRALARKREHEDLVHGLEASFASVSETARNVRVLLRALEARLAEARRKQRTLLARQRAAQARIELHRTLPAGFPDLGSPGAKFERFENRLRDLEDELAAQADVQAVGGALEEEFATFEASNEIERQLTQLKEDVRSKN